MEREQIEKTLEILKCYNDLFNMANELENVISEKHHELIKDIITEIENIAGSLSSLEHGLYYEYLKQ